MSQKLIQFNISASEVRRLARQSLSGKEVEEVLMAVENDNILWNGIESAILDAINMVKGNQNEQRT